MNRTPSLFWILANLIGLTAFVYFSSRIWAPHEDKGLLGGPGDPIIFGLTAFPVLVACALLNLGWLSFIAFRAKHHHPKRPLIIWLVVILLWAGGIEYVRSRMYTGCQIYPNNPSCVSLVKHAAQQGAPADAKNQRG
ncbi:MAG: hypothetical protein ACUZ8H_05625 [Candidatus Anammoxibacter sp.]